MFPLINCDMGEGIGDDAAIMPYIDVASVACGYHAGTEATISNTIQLAVQNGVKIGAHVSFPDKENFGRTNLNLSETEIYNLVVDQLMLFQNIADTFNIKPYHVKPHGALYNLSAKNEFVAASIAKAVKDVNCKLVLFGLSNSTSLKAASDIGLVVAHEVFADRSYQRNGALTSRTEANAVYNKVSDVEQQVLQLFHQKSVTALTGEIVVVQADTICIHSDHKHAVTFAKAIAAIKNKFTQ